MQPPPPQSPPPYIAPSAPQGRPPAPKLNVVGLVIGALVAISVMVAIPAALRQLRPSGVVVNGKTLSDSDARAGVREMIEMTRSAKAGDPNTINVGIEPKTEFGKAFKRLVIKSQGVEKTFATALNGKTIDQVMEPAALYSPEKRKAARADLARMQTAFDRYFKESQGVNSELLALFKGSSANAVDKSQRLSDQMNASATSLKSLVGVAEEMIDFIEESAPNVRGGVFEFATDAQVARYNALIDKYNVGTQALQDAEAKALRERQQDMSEAIRKADASGL